MMLYVGEVEFVHLERTSRFAVTARETLASDDSDALQESLRIGREMTRGTFSPAHDLLIHERQTKLIPAVQQHARLLTSTAKFGLAALTFRRLFR
jgi:hypothetical protein